MPAIGEGKLFRGGIAGAVPLTGSGFILTSGLLGMMLSGSPGMCMRLASF